jgi:hypothetical protein
MRSDELKIQMLAELLALDPASLSRHIVRPLAAPFAGELEGWVVPSIYRQMLHITDGLSLFGTGTHAFRLWGSFDYRTCSELFRQGTVEERLFPIFGEIPHLTSLSDIDGSVLCTDWECFGDRSDDGWRREIAANLQEYVRTVIQVREAYGYEEEWPSDWWRPYASHGTRFDLEASS